MEVSTKLKTKTQRAHLADGPTHKRDKAQAEQRRETTFVGMDAPQRPSPKRTFPGLESHEAALITNDNSDRLHVFETAAEFEDWIERQHRLRAWHMSITQRKGIPCAMKRAVEAALESVLVTNPPWANAWASAEIAAGRDVKATFAHVRDKLVLTARELLRRKRFLISYAFHSDTDDTHWHIVVSRYSGTGEKIGTAALELAGPWATSTDRQVRAGATISERKTAQLNNCAATFRKRRGEGVTPLDIALARAIDDAWDEAVGPELARWKKAYADSVPELERAHAAAELAALDAARAKILRDSAPQPSPTPTPSKPGPSMPL